MRRGVSKAVSAMVAAALMCSLVPAASFASEYGSEAELLGVPVQRVAASRQVQVTLPASELNFAGDGGLIVNNAGSWGELSTPCTFENDTAADLYLSGARFSQSSTENIGSLYAQGTGMLDLHGQDGSATVEVGVSPVETASESFFMPDNAKDVFRIGKESRATFQLVLDTAGLSVRPQDELEALCEAGTATVALGSIAWTVSVVPVTTNITFDWNGGIGRFLYGDSRDDLPTDAAKNCTATYGKNLPEIYVPVRNEWVFNGYYDEETDICYYDHQRWGSGIIPWDRTEATYTLKAAWRRPRVVLSSVSYACDENGRVLPGVQLDKINITVDLYDTFKHIDAPVVEGYTFVGLWLEPTGREPFQIYDQNGNPTIGPYLNREVWKRIFPSAGITTINAGEVINQDALYGSVMVRYRKN